MVQLFVTEIAAIFGGVKHPMTTNAAAAYLQVSRSAVQKAIVDRRLKAELVGRDYLIDRAEVERYRRERKLTGPRRQSPAP